MVDEKPDVDYWNVRSIEVYYPKVATSLLKVKVKIQYEEGEDIIKVDRVTISKLSRVKLKYVRIEGNKLVIEFEPVEVLEPAVVVGDVVEPVIGITELQLKEMYQPMELLGEWI